MTKISDSIYISTLYPDANTNIRYEYLYWFDMKSKKVSIFESYQRYNPVYDYRCILHQDCYVSSFSDIIGFMNLKEKCKVLCDTNLFLEIKENISKNDLNNAKIFINKDHKIQHFSIKNCHLIDISKIIPFTCLSIYLDMKENEDFNVLFCHIPQCLKQHGHKKLTLQCYLEDIKNTNSKLHTQISNASTQLEFIHKLDYTTFNLSVFQHKIYLLRYFIGECDRLVHYLMGAETITLLECNSFTEMSHRLFLGTEKRYFQKQVRVLLS